GAAVGDKFRLSASGVFDPGKKIEILIRRETEDDVVVFSGEAVSQNATSNSSGAKLKIGLRDPLYKLSVGRRNQIYEKLSDDDIIRQLLKSAHGTPGEIAAAGYDHEHIVQIGATNWDFLVSRADANGWWVTVFGGKLDAMPPAYDAAAQATYDLNLGDIIDFDLDADVEQALSETTSEAWSPASQAVVPSEAQSVEMPKTSSLLDVEGEPMIQTNLLDLPQKEMGAWSKANMVRNRLARLKGFVVIPGDSSLKLNAPIAFADVAPMFDGVTLVSGIRHSVSVDSSWQTELQIGASDQPFLERVNTSGLAAGGTVPAVSGLQIGKVTASDPDSEGHFRVQVYLPTFAPAKSENGRVWARLATPDAGNSRGQWFCPQTGDEVIVGFINGDPRGAVVIGSLFSSSQSPPVTNPASAADLSGQRVVRTPYGHVIRMDDNARSTEITTPNGQSIELADSGSAIFITAASKVQINAGSDVSIDAGSGTFAVRAGKIDIQGNNFTT
ncbi:MAG: type VI secretion system tip protein VgrG, partial [Verrucomicrobiota bacterium]